MWGPGAVTDGAGPKSQQGKERGVKLPQVGLAWFPGRRFLLFFLFFPFPFYFLKLSFEEDF